MRRGRKLQLAGLLLSLLLAGLAIWILAHRSGVAPPPTYSRQTNGVLATVSTPPITIALVQRLLPVADGKLEFRVLERQGTQWVESPKSRVRSRWRLGQGAQITAKVPDAEWKIEVHFATRRELRIGKFKYQLPWTTNHWTSPELPPLRGLHLTE